jgi:hypothetical protein
MGEIWVLIASDTTGKFDGLQTPISAHTRRSSFRKVCAPLAICKQHFIADDILRHTRRQIWELDLLRPGAVTHEAALLENVPGVTVLGMAQSLEPSHADVASQLNYRRERFRRVPFPPRVLRQHVTSDRLIGRLESETSASEQLSVATRPDQVGAGRPSFPFLNAERQECVRVSDGLMPGPAEKSSDIRIAGVALEDRVSVARFGSR